MKNFRKYNLFLLTLFGLLFFSMIGLAFFLEPLNGGLTRIGGYTENKFGWNLPQERFDSKLYRSGKNEIYDRYHDVVVIGDSFSNYLPDEVMHPAGYWPNYFVNETGLDLIAYNNDYTNIQELIESKEFQTNPPRVLIFQAVERSVIYIFSKFNGECVPGETPKIKPLEIKPIRKKLFRFDRNRERGRFNLDLDVSAHYLKTSIIKFFYQKLSPVIKVNLDRGGLFSSLESKDTLVYRGDFKKFSQNDKMRARCGMVNLQNEVQKNNKTFFVVMIAPNKLSAYFSYLKPGSGENHNLIDYFAKKPINLPRVDKALKSEIKNGGIDIYLPNDTHWGSEGHKIAAQTVIKYLEKRKIVKRSKGERL